VSGLQHQRHVGAERRIAFGERIPCGIGFGRLTPLLSIGSLAGHDAALPSELLRSRRIRLSGSGLGSFTKEQIFAVIPEVIAAVAEGTLEAPYTPYSLSQIQQAWAHQGRTRAVVVPD
jgi:hypothetical protein